MRRGRRLIPRRPGSQPRFADRVAAGRALADALLRRELRDPVVLGLPRGGVPVAAEVARVLAAPLDAVVVRKLGLPWQPELAMGAVGEDGVVVRNDAVLARVAVDAHDLARVVAREQAEVARRARLLRAGRPRRAVDGRTVVVVDDGLATGATARAALQVLRASGAGRLVLAVPVAPADTVEALLRDADEVVTVLAPERFGSVSAYYEDFTATPESEVLRLLHAAT
ncbi:MAG: Protein-L-isoaspartate O-methyltransferase [uncultured Frankineae bacterium]|uniref:Protein-L-isoaspartate O-methyltransferase n=1 Tax=uncultured Frankineae bacterium TaxID=437475 RepID=A0A6J4LUA3_9ACTN|nr:MAG: Protein-L-isoaspartate O-methyltransferase [uncultured Frankineae bacterium]